MPDWQQIVSSKLSGLALEPEEVTQVLEEVAGHLEEEYQSLLSKDVPEKEAARRALRRVDDWQALKQMIESARKKENPMPKRVAQFWLPAFLTLLLSMVLLAVIQMFGPNPWTRVVASAVGGCPLPRFTFPGYSSCRLSAHWERTCRAVLVAQRERSSFPSFSPPCPI